MIIAHIHPGVFTTIKSRTLHLALLAVSWLAYLANRYQRPSGGENWIRDSLPSLLFPLACFSLVAVLPACLGGNNGQPVCRKNILIGTLLACFIFEGIAPWLGWGSADWNDVLALLSGGLLYTAFSVLAK
ncbi:MAG: hypothetical protein AAF649_05415 [Verrucomicrobiota bacterium]